MEGPKVRSRNKVFRDPNNAEIKVVNWGSFKTKTGTSRVSVPSSAWLTLLSPWPLNLDPWNGLQYVLPDISHLQVA